MAKMFGKKTHFMLLGSLLACLLLAVRDAGASILLFGNETLSFSSLDAAFTPPIPEAGVLGDVYVADPLTGCSAFGVHVTGKVVFAVVQRGECPFEQKVRNSQDAGFAGTIVFDAGDGDLITMSGHGEGITTYALFVSKEAGESLISLNGTVYVLPGQKKTSFSIKWLIISVSLIVVVIVGALVTALCCIRAHILAHAEKEAEQERLLHDDDYILNREFIPDDEGFKVETAESVTTDADGESVDLPRSEGGSETHRTPENLN